MNHSKEVEVSTGFDAFDNVTNGLKRAESYLVYGMAGLGKTTFALSFISEGIVAGETTALITGQNPSLILEQARCYGLDFEKASRNNQLILLEYPEEVLGASSRLLDDVRIVEEFRSALAGSSVQRVVFDPITPLLAGPTQAFVADRFRVISNSIREMGATALYVVDLPQGQAQANVAKELVYGVIRFEEARDGRRIALESVPEAPRGESVRFELEPGLGLRAASDQPKAVVSIGHGRPARSAAVVLAGGRAAHHLMQAATILVIDPDESQAAQTQAALGPSFTVVAASGAADGLSAVAIHAPDLVVIAEQVRGGAGVEIVRKLRGAGRNLPVVMLSRRLRRVSDEAALLQAGIDVLVRVPTERSLLRPSIWNLLRRTGVIDMVERGRGEYDAEALASEVNCTADPDYFIDRVLHDSAFCDRFGAPCTLFVMRSGRHLLDELASVVALFTRATDLVFTGDRGVLVLLAGAGDPAPFLDRFRRNWKGTAMPFVDEVAGIGPMNHAALRPLIAETVGIRNTETEAKRAISSAY